MAESLNWQARLAVKFVTDTEELISPITSLNPNADLPKDVMDSIDAENIGYSYKNRRFTFDFEMYGVNTAVGRKIWAAANNGAHFDVLIQIKEGESDDWVFDSVQLNDCVITSANKTIDNSGGVPMMKFSAAALGMSTTNDGQTLVTNNSGGATGSLS
jgi:hypothetical protein